jgi:imidazolonepropionase
MNDILISHASQIATPVRGPKRGKALRDITIHKNASIYCVDGIIRIVGSAKAVESQITGNPTVINAAGKTVIPGFVDAHTHLVFAGTRENEFVQRLSGMTYKEIAEKGGGILSTVQRTRAASKDELIQISMHYLHRALAHGTTTMEVKTGYGLEPETEMKMLDVINELNTLHSIELIPTFLGAHSFPKDISRKTYIEQVITMIPEAAKRGAKFCDVFCEPGYYTVEESRQILERAKECRMKPRIHTDQFLHSDGVRLAVELEAASVDHLEQLSDEDISRLADSNTTAILFPGVSLFLGYNYPPARRIIDAGCITAIGTDFNPGSCMCLSMQMMMSLACMQMKLLPAEALTAATINPAYSLGLDNVGALEPGMQADILIADVSNYEMIPYFFGENHVETVIKNGKIIS